MTSRLPSRALPPITSGRFRLIAAALAVAASAGLLSALLLAFDTVSPASWLVATPEVLNAVAACDSKRARTDRQACKQQFAAHQRTPASAPQQLAKQ